MSYILYSSALIGLSYIMYKLLLSKETFYDLNRWVLLSLIVLSVVVPYISVPASISFRAAIEKQATVSFTQTKATEGFVSTNTTSPNNTSTSSSETTGSSSTASIIAMDWKSIITYIYILGVMAFGINFLIQLGVLIFRMLKHPTIEVDKYKIVETNRVHAPYSFWNRIFINPSQYDPDTYLQIIKHEQIHIAGAHSLDMLMVELLVSIQWFNPFSWLYRKEIDNNLEYLTDNAMLAFGEDKETYQMNLLKVSTPDMPTGLATSYNQSFLKKRILMMNSKKSTAKSGWKYLIIIPLLSVTVLSFNPVTVSSPIDKETEPSTQNVETNSKISNTTTLDFTRGVWDAEVGGGKLCVMYRSAEPLKRNFWSTTHCYETTYFNNFPDGDRQELEIKKDPGTMTYRGQFENGIGDGRYTFVPNENFIKAVKKQGLEVDNKDLVHCFLTGFDTEYLAYLTSEKLALNQKDFEDIIHKSLPLDKLKMYRKELKRLGYNEYTMKEIAKLNLFDVDPTYISFINKVNNNKTSLAKITKAKIHKLTPEFIKSYNTNGYGAMTLDEYIKLKIHNVTPAFISGFKKQGYTDISAKEAQNLKIHNVTPAFVKAFKDIGFNDISLKEAKNLKIHNVTADLIQSYKDAGQSNISLKEAIKLKIHNITPSQAKAASKQNKKSSKSINKSQNKSHSHSDKDFKENTKSPNEFIKQFKALGYENISVDDIIKLKIHNVTPDFIKRFNDVGFTNIPLDKAVSLKIHNVTPEYIASFKKAGYKDIPLNKATSLKIHNVSPDDASEYVKLGYKSITVDDLISFRIHNVTPQYLRDFKKTKFGDLPLNDIVSFKIHNVTPKFIEAFEAIGFTSITTEQARSLKIHNVTPEFVQSLKDEDPSLSIDQAIRIKIHF